MSFVVCLTSDLWPISMGFCAYFFVTRVSLNEHNSIAGQKLSVCISVCVCVLTRVAQNITTIRTDF